MAGGPSGARRAVCVVCAGSDTRTRFARSEFFQINQLFVDEAAARRESGVRVWDP